MLDGKGRPHGDGAVQAAVSRQCHGPAGRSSVHGSPAGGGRPELADAALSPAGEARRSAALGKGTGGGTGLCRPQGAGPADAGKGAARPRRIQGAADRLSAGGASVPSALRALPAGGRNGPGQNGAGAGVAVPDRGLSRRGGGPAPSDAQLGKRDRPLRTEA